MKLTRFLPYCLLSDEQKLELALNELKNKANQLESEVAQRLMSRKPFDREYYDCYTELTNLYSVINWYKEYPK